MGFLLAKAGNVPAVGGGGLEKERDSELGSERKGILSRRIHATKPWVRERVWLGREKESRGVTE